MLLWAWEWAPCCNWERAVCMLIWSLREGWSVWAVRLSYSFLSWSFFSPFCWYLLWFSRLLFLVLASVSFYHLSSHLLLRYCCLFFLKIVLWIVLTWGYFCPVHIVQIQFILFIDLFFLFGYWTPPVSLCPGFDCPDCCKGLVLYCQVRPLHSYSLPASCFLFPVFCGWAKGSPSIVSFHYVAVWTMSFHRGKWITINSDRSMFLTFIYYSYDSWMNMAFD